MFFGAISRICNEISCKIDDEIDNFNLGYIIFDFSTTSDIDTTAIAQLSELAEDYCEDAFICVVVSSELYIFNVINLKI